MPRRQTKESAKATKDRAKIKRREIIASHKKMGCCICGYNKCLDALDFHHVDDNKTFDISRVTNGGIDRLYKELAKCIVVCANCHREIHSGELRTYRNVDSEQERLF